MPTCSNPLDCRANYPLKRRKRSECVTAETELNPGGTGDPRGFIAQIFKNLSQAPGIDHGW
jgi:hypothetical protein